MNLRIVATPLGASVAEPPQRDGGVPPEILPAFHAAAAAESRLADLADPAVLVVTTGQQPGLFTGPLYTVYKALSAAALARVLAARWERPVVPVFWAAGDDHDFAEVNHASWLDAAGEVRTAVLRDRAPDAPLTPMYRERLGPEVETALAALARDLPPSEFRDGVVDWLRASYRPGATVGGAYRSALTELLGSAGVVVFESTHRAAKAAMRPWIMAALEHARPLDAALAERAAELRAAGADPGVAAGDDATLVMLEAEQGRDRLVGSAGDGFVTRRSGERFSLDQLRAIADAEPERLSGNVLLRPVLESAVLPTVAYVAGPGELRYLAMTPPVYAALGVPRQIPVPRWSGVLVEPRVDRVLDKFGISLDDLLEPGPGLEQRLVRDRLPEEAVTALAQLRTALESGYGKLASAATDVDPTLARFIEGARNRALGGTHDAEKKLVRHLKRRCETELAQLRRAQAAVRPGGGPQERALTAAPFLARHGPGLVSAVLGEADRWYARALETAAAGK